MEGHQSSDRSFLVVGLGNPGAKYRGTRHNIGFDCLEDLKERLGFGGPATKFQGEWVKGKVDGREIYLLWPLTYMNLSGRCVQPFASFFKIPVSQILVICDDLALPLGRLRLRSGGSAGGQKGLQDILRSLGTQDVPRLRLGVGACPPEWDAADYVLSRFRKEEVGEIDHAIKRSGDAVLCWISDGVDVAMNRFNRAETTPPN